MAPWLSSALLSPWVFGGFVLLVILSTVVLRFFADRVFQDFNISRLVTGYGAALVALFPLSLLITSFSIQQLLLTFVFLAYVTSFSLAVFIVPGIVAVMAIRRRVVNVATSLIVSAASGFPLELGMRWLVGPSAFESSTRMQLLSEFLRLEALLVLVGLAFALGARIPWRAD